MKKLIFTTLSSIALLSAFGQASTSTRLIDNSIPDVTQLKPIPNQKMLNGLNVFSKTGLGNWFSTERTVVNRQIPLDNSSGNPSANTYRISYYNMANDSFVRIAYTDPQLGPKFYNANMHNVGFLFDGRSLNYDAFPGTASTLTNYTPYSIDSVNINFIYQRFNTTNTSDDTLYFQVFYPKWTNNDTVQNTPISDASYQDPSTEAIGTIDYNASANMGRLRGGSQGYMVSFGIPLTINDTSLANPDGSVNIKNKTFALPTPISMQRRTRFAVTFKFNPAIPYAYGDTINGDTSAMKLVVKRNSSFRVAMISDYSAYNEADKRVYPVVDRIYNLGLLARTETRYNYTAIFPSGSFFSGRYYSAGFTSSQGIGLTIFPAMDAYINNAQYVGINEANNNISSSIIYPNPANINGISTLALNLKSSSKVSVQIFNLMGQLVKTVANKTFDSGENTVDMNLSGLNAGVYFVNINVNGVAQTKKLTIVQ